MHNLSMMERLLLTRFSLKQRGEVRFYDWTRLQSSRIGKSHFFIDFLVGESCLLSYKRSFSVKESYNHIFQCLNGGKFQVHHITNLGPIEGVGPQTPNFFRGSRGFPIDIILPIEVSSLTSSLIF